MARLHLPAEALTGVTSSVELADALRRHLTLDLTMPLQEPITVSLRGLAGGTEGIPAVLQVPALRYEGTDPLEGFSLARAIEESRGPRMDNDGWDEFDADEAGDDPWRLLVQVLDAGLSQSAKGFGPANGGGHVGLRVESVRIPEFSYDALGGGQAEEYYWCCREEEEGPILQLAADLWFPSMGDEKGPAEALQYDQTIVVIQLGPAETPRNGMSDDGTSDDARALEVSEQFAFACDPAALTAASPSEARVLLSGEEWGGHALARIENSGELILVLADLEASEPYCLVFSSPGGMVEAGHYDVLPLTPELLDGSLVPDSPVFVAAMNGTDATFVTESGHVEITAARPEIRGTFELGGWIAEGDQRHDGVTLTGSFVLASPEGNSGR